MQEKEKNPEIMRQLKGVLRKSKKLIAGAETEKDWAAGLAMCEGYLQAFYFSGVISREEYTSMQEEIKAFRRLDAYRRKAGRKGA